MCKSSSRWLKILGRWERGTKGCSLRAVAEHRPEYKTPSVALQQTKQRIQPQHPLHLREGDFKNHGMSTPVTGMVFSWHAFQKKNESVLTKVTLHLLCFPYFGLAMSNAKSPRLGAFISQANPTCPWKLEFRNKGIATGTDASLNDCNCQQPTDDWIKPMTENKVHPSGPRCSLVSKR